MSDLRGRNAGLIEQVARLERVAEEAGVRAERERDRLREERQERDRALDREREQVHESLREREAELMSEIADIRGALEQAREEASRKQAERDSERQGDKELQTEFKEAVEEKVQELERVMRGFEEERSETERQKERDRLRVLDLEEKLRLEELFRRKEEAERERLMGELRERIEVMHRGMSDCEGEKAQAQKELQHKELQLQRVSSEVQAYKSLVADMEKVADKLKTQAALDAADLERSRQQHPILVSKCDILTARVEELESQVQQLHCAKTEVEDKILLVEAQKGELSVAQLALQDTKMRENLGMQARVAELEGERVILKQRAALADQLQQQVLELQEKLSSASHELGLSRSQVQTLNDKEAYLQHELSNAHGEAHVHKSARAACDLEIVRQAQDVSALMERLGAMEEERKVLRGRVQELESVNVMTAQRAVDEADAAREVHTEAERSWLAREELLRNLIVHAEAQIDRLSSELYGDAAGSRVSLRDEDEVLGKVVGSGRAGPASRGAWQVSDLVDRLMHLEAALLECQAIPAHKLTERSAAGVASAAELAGYQHRVRQLEEDLADANRKLATKEVLRKKLDIGQKKIEVLTNQVLALHEVRPVLTKVQ